MYYEQMHAQGRNVNVNMCVPGSGTLFGSPIVSSLVVSR